MLRGVSTFGFGFFNMFELSQTVQSGPRGKCRCAIDTSHVKTQNEIHTMIKMYALHEGILP